MNLTLDPIVDRHYASIYAEGAECAAVLVAEIDHFVFLLSHRILGVEVRAHITCFDSVTA